MKELNILHISDAHIQKKNMTEISEIVQKLVADVKKVEEEKKLSIDLVCFTGDLIQRGDEALEGEKQWALATDILITPLLRELGLSDERFVFVPGNHEVDISKIVPRLEKGLIIESLRDINEIMDNFYDSYNGRVSYFYELVKKRLPDVRLRNLGYSYNIEINRLKVGIACVDSAWRSSGKGKIEKGKLYVGAKQIRELYQDISKSDIKICMIHHPVDWLEDCESLEIERELSKFNIVLRGHIHEEDLKQIARMRFTTLYSTAGKLYPLDFMEGRVVEGYNGYSILNVEYDRHKCNVFFRSYFGKNRKEFDTGLNICPNGEESYDMFFESGAFQVQFGVMKGISQFFYNMSERYALIKDIDAKSPKDVKQILVDPVLAYKSEYIKENNNVEEKEINIQNIFESADNILLIGKKETGKTTVLQQIGLKYIDHYEIKGVIPVYLNMKYLPKGTNRVLESTVHFIQTNILNHEAISRDEIINLINTGKMVFLIDNVDSSDHKHTRWLEKFIKEYNNNRYILTIEEEFFQSLDIRQLPDYGASFKEIYIQYMGKSQIRSIVTKWAEGREDDINVNETVNKIDSYFNQINFAKTPFNIAILMVIWDESSGYVPSNEGIIMENYMEVILEKLSPEESLRSTYAFRIKQNFLSFVAYKMYLKKEFFLEKEEFDEIVRFYHQKKGYNLGKSKFDSLFFNKNILSYSGGYVVFSHTSFLEYFLALYARDDKEFLEEITKKGTRIRFRNEICFYAGLSQDCTELLDIFSEDIISKIIEHMDLINSLNDMHIISEFKIDKDQFIAEITKNRPTQEELDNAHDQIYQHKGNILIEIDGSETDIDGTDDSTEDFYSLLLIYGSIIKNTELLDNKYKVEHLEYYMFGMNMLYALMINEVKGIKEDLKFNEISDEDKAYLNISTEEEFEKAKDQTIDFSKIILPIGMQNLILENVGTPKLEAAINELIKCREDKSFEKFMLTFLKCDLNIVRLNDLLKNYIKKEKSKDILKLVLMKLTFYYRSRFFGNDIQTDKALVDLITETSMKINPRKHQNIYNSNKSKVAQSIKFELDKKNN